jgi:uncharacterized membrane protein
MTKRSLVLWAHRRILWLSRHWLATFNTFFFVFTGLPFLAPILLAYGYSGPANLIYTFYQAVCHQLPSRSYFILGEQVAFCQRDVAIYGSLAVGGLFFNVVSRLPRLALRWYVFFLVPIAVDGGMQLASDWLHIVSMNTLWAAGLVGTGLVSAILHSRRYLTWHSYLFFAAGPLSLLYLSYFGPYLSTWYLRTLTGTIFGLGTIWYAYPYLDESFRDIEQQVREKLARASASTVPPPVGRR